MVLVISCFHFYPDVWTARSRSFILFGTKLVAEEALWLRCERAPCYWSWVHPFHKQLATALIIETSADAMKHYREILRVSTAPDIWRDDMTSHGGCRISRTSTDNSRYLVGGKKPLLKARELDFEHSVRVPWIEKSGFLLPVKHLIAGFTSIAYLRAASSPNQLLSPASCRIKLLRPPQEAEYDW